VATSSPEFPALVIAASLETDLAQIQETASVKALLQPIRTVNRVVKSMFGLNPSCTTAEARRANCLRTYHRTARATMK